MNSGWGCGQRTDTAERGCNERRCIKNMTTTVKNIPRGSNWTNGDGSTSWTGARPTWPTSASGPCGSGMAGTKARVRDSHRDRRPPSAFPTLKAPRPTRT